MVAERVIRLVVMCRQDAICGTPMRAAQVSDGWTGQCLRIAQGCSRAWVAAEDFRLEPVGSCSRFLAGPEADAAEC